MTLTVVLVLVWAGALAGWVCSCSGWPSGPRWLSATSYAALGVVAVFVLPELLRHGSVVALALLCTGGGLYLLGALAYATRRPNPLPSTFGFHEVFHACTVLAATCHYIGLVVST